jgi:hypothetical protein
VANGACVARNAVRASTCADFCGSGIVNSDIVNLESKRTIERAVSWCKAKEAKKFKTLSKKQYNSFHYNTQKQKQFTCLCQIEQSLHGSLV